METFEDPKLKMSSQLTSGSTSKPRYEKELVKTAIVEISFHYLGPGRRQGMRYVWRCPECGKDEKFSVTTQKGLAGCLNSDCPMPKTMDSIQMISHFERIPPSGPGFARILSRGYEILNLPEPGPTVRPEKKKTVDSSAPAEDSGSGPGNGSSQRSYQGPSGPPPEAQDFGGWTRAPAAAPITEREGHWENLRPGAPEDPKTVYEEDRGPHDGPDKEQATGSSDLLPAVPDDVVTVEPDDDIEVVEAEIVEDSEDNRWESGAAQRSRSGRTRYERLDAHRTYQMGTMGVGLRGDAEAWALYEEPDFTLDETLADAVYSAILEMCRLEDVHAEWLKGRGVSRMTALRGRMGSMSRSRARAVKKVLLERFSEDDLLRVPGFSKKALRGISWTLSGDYILIPYHDADHNIRTIEGRAFGEPPKGMGKYVSLRGSGNHLYVFPDFMPERLEAFCEGPMGAIVAAQSDIAVGAIQGVRRHRDSATGGPLVELSGTDFDERRIPYIPDIDVKPAAKADVAAEIPNACHNLIERQNGIPQVALLPEGKDLDEWLLTKKSGERRPAFTSFVASAVSLNRYQRAVKPDQPTPGNPATPEPMPERKTTRRERDGRHARPSRPGPLYEDPAQEQPNRNVGNDRGQPQGQSTDTNPSAKPTAEPEQKFALEISTTTTTDETKFSAKVYSAVVRMSSLQDRDIALMDSFGIPEEITRQAGICSMSAARAHGLAKNIAESMGAENVAEVSGFSSSPAGGLTIEFTGDYCLIPYRDASGSITALQSIPVADDGNGPRVDSSRKNILCGTPGDHLYLPAGQPERIEVLTTSVLEALRLLASSVRAAAIRNPEAYKPAPGSQTLPELAGVDYDGRVILYAPLLGNPPRANTQENAPHLMRALIARHGGIPAMIKRQTEILQEGMTLGESLIATATWERRDKFDAHLRHAERLHNLFQGERNKEGSASVHEAVIDNASLTSTQDTNLGATSNPDSGTEPENPTPPRIQEPVMVPGPHLQAPAPPHMKTLLTPDEVLSGLAMIFICMTLVLSGLSLWHLPAELASSTIGAIGGPVSGRSIDPVPFVLIWGEAAFGAVLSAVAHSLAGAVFWGSVAACAMSPLAVWRRRSRRKRVRQMLRVQNAPWWANLIRALHG